MEIEGRKSMNEGHIKDEELDGWSNKQKTNN